MKKGIRFSAVLLLLAALSGCGTVPPLPENPTEFVLGTFQDPSNPADQYASIAYNGRTYILFGTLKGALPEDGEILGYLVQDGVKNKQIRVYRLAEDGDADFLMERDLEGLMEQPVFLRAVDTAGKALPVPSYIEPLEYAFWKCE